MQDGDIALLYRVIIMIGPSLITTCIHAVIKLGPLNLVHLLCSSIHSESGNRDMYAWMHT